ncbi:hypothetical protein KGO95_04355 [Patescibacteria group bacterium]|nr:hypothetical protein [Patescibacteria group bacterium]
MEPTPPDLSTWLENQAARVVFKDKGKIIGLVKTFMKYDLQHPDPRYRQKERRCAIFYAFGVIPVIKSWNAYDEDTTGKIYKIEYVALLVDRKMDAWIIGLPNENLDQKLERDEKSVIVAITFFLKTTEGDRSIRIVNPYR